MAELKFAEQDGTHRGAQALDVTYRFEQADQGFICGRPGTVIASVYRESALPNWVEALIYGARAYDTSRYSPLVTLVMDQFRLPA